MEIMRTFMCRIFCARVLGILLGAHPDNRLRGGKALTVGDASPSLGDWRSRLAIAGTGGWLVGILIACAHLGLLAPVSLAQTTNITLVPVGSVWKYLDNGSDQGTAWQAITFDDSTWASGPAQLGYGDGDERTVVGYGPDANFKYVTTYFRRAFTVTDPSSFTALTVRLLRDDGGVVYLNGVEVFRSNMPFGFINYLSFSATTIPNSDESVFFSTNVSPALLVSGTNEVAVEIHQANRNSSDISFDLSLVATSPLGPPVINQQPQDQRVAAGGTAAFSVRAAGTPPLRYQWQFNGSDIPGATNATLRLTGVTSENEGRYWVTITNALGFVVSDKASLNLVNLSGDFFQITRLSADNVQAIEHFGLTGDDRGGIAASFSDLFVTGDDSTARFNLGNLSDGTRLGQIYDTLASDLRSGKVYALANGTTPATFGPINTLLELDTASGSLTTNTILLSTNVDLSGCSGCMGVFSGFGRIVLHNGTRAFAILLPSGTVQDLGLMAAPPHQYSENWAYWGVAEYFGGANWIAYVRDYQTIVRTRVPDGLTLTVAAFTNLSDMASFTVSPLFNRWYFHHQYTSQFRSGSETAGFADAAFAHEQQPEPPDIILPPRDRTALQGSNATFTVLALGYPLNYQWQFNGLDIVGATNQTLTLNGVTGAQVGLYSVTVGNDLGQVTSSQALLDVVSGGGSVSSVAVFGAEANNPAWNEDVRQKLGATGLFGQVDAFQAAFGAVPTLDQLLNYDAVLVYSDNSFSDPVALGNVLADYVDAGRGVVLATFVFNISLQGRMVSGGYYPFNISGQSGSSGLTLIADQQSHPILAGVTSFNGGGSGFHNSPVNVTTGTELVAHWSNGQPLVGVKEFPDGRVVGLNFFPPSSDVRNDFWDARTDGALLMANALLWAGGGRGNTVPLVAPGIRTQPTNTTVLQGLDGKFTVTAFGSPSLAYQWLANGLPISAATNRTLVLTNLQTNQSGAYSVIITNAYGAVTSQVATLTVQPSRGVAGYYTDFNTASTGLAQSIVRASFSPLRIEDIATFDFGRLKVLMIDESSDPPSSNLRKRLPDIQAWVNNGGRLVVHQRALNTAAALTSNPFLLGVQGALLVNYYSTDVDVIPPATNLVLAGPHGTLNNASLDSTEINYTAYATRATLPPGAAAFLSTPGNANQVLAFAYGLGAGLVYYSTIPLDYYVDYSSSLLSSMMRDVYAPNVLEYVFAFAPTGPPIIFTQPGNVLTPVGTPAAFSVSTRGQLPLLYQWFFKGAPLAGATNNPLQLTNVTVADAGAYAVTVSNALGSATSSNATLTVVPRITVAVFNDPRYVAMPGGPSENVQAALQQLGHIVRPITNLLSAVTNDVLLFPEFGNRALAPDLDNASRTLLKAYVAQGGLIIAQGGYANVDLFNSVFEMALSPNGCFTGLDFFRTPQATGTPFADGPLSIPGNNCTYTLALGTWPAGSLPLYTNNFYGSTVTLIPYGAGALLHLGWNWNDAAPLGSQDGGWAKVLANALQARGVVSAPPLVSVPLVPLGSVWRYLDNGSDQGTAWRGPGFNDSSWATGPAQLGYGDFDEATIVGFGPDSNNKYVTTYFRRAFMATNTSTFTNLTLRLLRDDGAAVYLNGTEVVRDCLQAGALFNTYALCTISDAAENVYLSYSVGPGLLREGTNVLAVEIHQVNGSSSDISFDLELTGAVPLASPVIKAQPAGHVILAGSSVALDVVAAGLLPMRYQWRLDGQDLPGATNAILLLSGLTTNQAGGYSVFISNQAGSVLSSNALVNVVEMAGDSFRIATLSTNNAVVVDDYPFAGDDRGGIAASAEQVFYSGDSGTARFPLADLSGGANAGVIYDALLSDLKTETVYSLGNRTNLINSSGGIVTTLLEMNGSTGAPTGASVSLSQPIDLENKYGQVGLFAGWGRVVIHDGTRAWSIELPAGLVVELGAVSVPQRNYAENWAYWGVAEWSGDSIWLDYVRDYQTIVRTRVSDGLTEPVAVFENLSDMASFTVSLPYNRWYFHHQFTSQFSTFYETTGFADAAFVSSAPPLAPSIVKQPEDQTVAASGGVVLRTVARGTGPLQYQWRFEGTALPGATNATLRLNQVTTNQSGHYSVLVSNVISSVLSSNAVVTVVPLGGETFRIANLTTNGVVVADDYSFAGDDRGAIALSGQRTFYSGDNGTARFDLADLSGGTNLGRLYDGLVSDLGTETVYALADGTNLLTGNGGVVSTLLEVEGVTGGLTGSRVTLSQPIVLGRRFGDVGIFAGLGRVVVTDGAQAWNIETPSGRVVSLGPMTMPLHAYTEVGAYWGIAEFFGGSIWLVYVRDSQTIVRTRVADGFTETVANFLSLSDMAAITVSLPFNRWYFHHQYSSQFSSFYGTIGFADATFVSSAPPIAPSVVKSPQDQSIGASGTVEFRVVARGTAPLGYQWLFEGAPLPGATNITLTLTNVSIGQAGHYSVSVSNAAGSDTSAAALLRVEPSVTVALFNDPAFAYTNQYAQSDNLRASLLRLGHRAANFTNIIQAAGGSAPLLFPALEASDLASVLTTSVRSALQDFVGRGGTLIIHGTANDPARPTRFLNAVFDFALFSVYDSLPATRTAQASGTAFADDPGTLAANNTTWGLTTDSLPPGARSVYQTSDRTTVLGLIPFGGGKIIFLGWNWNDAVPQGRQDGGWLTVLESAIEETLPRALHTPEILAEPRSRTVVAGTSARFWVAADGAPLAYQWLFNGQPLAGITNYLLQLSNVTTNRTGNYSVIVSNASGYVVSSNALLTVVAPVTVGVFDDARFVNTAGGIYASSDNLQATLSQLGHRVQPFTNILAATTNQVLVFPVFDQGDPLSYLDNATRAGLQSFVQRGGLLITHGYYNNVYFLNSLFGLSLSFYGFGGGPFIRTAQTAGTPLANGPGALSYNDGTLGLYASALPSFGARNLFGGFNADWLTAVALIPYGSGNLAYLGWNWQNAVPTGSQDGGWVETLGNMVLLRVVPNTAPPTITLQPQDQNLLAGMDAIFSIGGYGAQPLLVQWFLNSLPLPGATNAVLALPFVNVDQGGDYQAVISNSSGSVTSQVARLGVHPARGSVGYFTDYNPSTSGPYAPILQAGFTPLPIYDISTYDVSRLAMLMIDEAGGGLPSSPLLSRLPDIEDWVAQGGKLLVHDRTGTGSSIPFLLGASATVLTNDPGDDIEILAPGDNLVVAGPHGQLDGTSLDGGSSSYQGYAQRSTLPARALPILGAGPNTNNVVAFSYALGAGSVYYAAMPLDYFLDACCFPVWARFKTNYTPNVLEHAAVFTVTGPPAILAQPRSAGARAGGTVTLRVSANGSGPLFYYWLFNGEPIPGITGAALVLSDITTNQAGGYSVIVSNALGTAISGLATLSVVQPAPFRIIALTTSNSQVVDHAGVTGDDRGGIGVSATHVYYTGDSATARFSATNLTGATALAQRYEALVSDLRTETLYTLANDTDLISGPSGYVTALIEINGSTGVLTSNRLALSTSIPLGFDTGIFAGYGAVVLHTGNRLYRIELPSGVVLELGAMPSFPHYTCENWAYWGVAEFFAGSLYLDYVRDSQTIVRTRVPDGATTNLSSFSNLGDMCSFSVSLPRNRWYFHYQGSAQFGGTAETLGYATATFDRPPRSSTVLTDRVIDEDSSTGPIGISVVDESPAVQLLLAASSSNPLLLPETGIVITGTNTSRTVTLTPAPSQFGTALVTLVVTDPIGQTTNRSFTLTVNPVNDAPVFTAGPDQFVRVNAGPQTVPRWATGISPGPANEGEQGVSFVVTNNNGSLFATAPAIGADGTLTYTPTLGSSGTALVTVVLHDDGGTNFSGVDASGASQFIITVIPETNGPPVLLPIPNQTAYVLTRLVLTNAVADAAIPANSFTFRLGPGAPAGARISTNRGVFTWTPSRAQAASSNYITVIVTDHGVPPLSATNSFSVVVADFLELSLGSTVLQVGQTGSVSVTSLSSSGVTNLNFVLEAPADRLSDWSLGVLPPGLVDATLHPRTANLSAVALSTQAGQPLVGTNLLATLSFTTSSNQTSAFIPLAISELLAMQVNGIPMPKTLSNNGRVVAVGAAPLMEAQFYTNAHRGLVLYANPGIPCVLESSPNPADPASWQVGWQGSLTNLFQVFDLIDTGPSIFYRARR